MKIQYEKHLKKITNRIAMEGIEFTFSKVFPNIIEQCEDEQTSVKIFISFSELIGAIRENRSSNVKL